MCRSFNRFWVFDCWSWVTGELRVAAGAQAFLETALLQDFVWTCWASLLLEVWVGRSLGLTGLMLLLVAKLFGFSLIRGHRAINIWLWALRIQPLRCFVIFIRTITSNNGLHRTIFSKCISASNRVRHNQRLDLTCILFHRRFSKRCFLNLFISLFNHLNMNICQPCYAHLFGA